MDKKINIVQMERSLELIEITLNKSIQAGIIGSLEEAAVLHIALDNISNLIKYYDASNGVEQKEQKEKENEELEEAEEDEEDEENEEAEEDEEDEEDDVEQVEKRIKEQNKIDEEQKKKAEEQAKHEYVMTFYNPNNNYGGRWGI